MNTNNPNLNPEIEMLKQESAPGTLKARIIKGILDDRKSKNMTTRKIIGFGLPAIAVGALAFGALLAPKAAVADPIAQIRDAFQSERDYHMTTYRTENGKRSHVSESWVKNGKRTTYTVEPNGEMTLLNNQMTEVQRTVSGRIVVLRPTEVAHGWTVKKNGEEKIVAGHPIEVQSTDNEVYEVELKAVPGQRIEIAPEGRAVFEVQRSDVKEGSFVELRIAPFVDAEMSIEALQKLLEDKSLWSIEPNKVVNGKVANQYKLNKSYMDFAVYVDPQTKLPILTRQTLNDEEGKSTITEVEYDYLDSIPPTVPEKVEGFEIAVPPATKK
ncbi:MAG: hypothetical protein ACKVQS_03595 [Fimbriimonadaceae bacterium]